jgi:hypothetical protein
MEEWRYEQVGKLDAAERQMQRRQARKDSSGVRVRAQEKEVKKKEEGRIR